MSSATVPFTSTNSIRPAPLIFGAGLFSAALQTVFFREFLSVFSGNELSIGLVLCVWLLAVGAGTMLSSRRSRAAGREFPAAGAVFALVACAAAGITIIRASRLVFLPGAALGPLQMLAVAAAGELPFAFANGLILGALFSRSAKPGLLYGWENAGAASGALAVFACVLAGAPNSLIAAVAALPLLFLCARKPWFALACLLVLALVVMLDRASVQWKYAIPSKGIVYGREGEIVRARTGADTTFLLNGALYKSTMQKPALEQAVHIPMGQRADARRVLVVFDRGQKRELAEYPGCSVDVVETEPAFAARGSTIAAIETFRPAARYDMVFLGTGIPRTAAANRFYTRSFLARVKTFLTDSGIVAFTLPFSENYFSPAEKKLYDALRATLSSVFPHVLVFPGEGYTFMASAAPLSTRWNVRAHTAYLAPSIVPAASEERIAEANRPPTSGFVNTRDRPLALLLGLESWIELFKNQFAILVALLAVCFCAALWFAPRNRPTFSVGTSGLVLGAYSVCLLLVYQSTCGALYSRVSLLLVALTAGFWAGAFVKKLPLSDAAIGLYCGATLVLLSAIPSPAAFLFYAFHAGAGVLGGAQIVSRKNTGLGGLYAVDVFGGAMGMVLCSTLLVPLVGIVPVAVGMIGIKGVVEIVNLKK
jgi:spermidine synthase